MRTRRIESLVFLIGMLGLIFASPAFSQESAEPTSFTEAKAELEKAAKSPDVVEDLAEPDGAAIDDLEPDNWKIIAIGTGTYEFNDTEERQDATEEATLNAKAAMVKFMKERLSTETQRDALAEKSSKKSKENGEQVTSATANKMRTTLTSIHNSADEILSGIITLETTDKWDGNSGQVRVKVGQSAKTLKAAEKFKSRTLASTKEADKSGAGAARSATGAPGSKPGSSSQPETIKQKSKSAF